MFKKELLIDKLRPLQDKELRDFKNEIDYNKEVKYRSFIRKFESNLQEQTSNTLKGLEVFPYKHVQTGVDQYIQTLILKHTIKGLQIFEHDYYWYPKIYPDIQYTTLDTLTADKPLLMAMPFPGYLGKHPELDKILDTCDNKNIDVHLDCAWLPSSFDIEFNFDRPCIKSFATSLSKCYGLDWSRVGMRWQRTEDKNDPITYENVRGEFNNVSISIGYQYLKAFPLDYLIHKHKKNYLAMCKELWLRPSKIIHAVHSLDRSKLYGCRHVLEEAMFSIGDHRPPFKNRITNGKNSIT